MIQKLCFKCQISKPYSEFYKHRMMADGYLGKCISCVKEYERLRLIRLSSDPIWMEKELARHREKSARARALGKKPNLEAYRTAQANWYARNKLKKTTHGKVCRALKSGKLTRQPCQVCGEMRVQAHHEDYSKPLDVMWLCTKHHAERHVELNKIKRTY
jgi:hypothetical protein